MTALSPAMQAAFDNWKRATLISHYVNPCPDEVGDAASEDECNAIDRIAVTPSETLADLAIKVLVLSLDQHGEHLGLRPFQAEVRRRSGTNYLKDTMWIGIIDDLPRLLTCIGEVVAIPHRDTFRASENQEGEQ